MQLLNSLSIKNFLTGIIVTMMLILVAQSANNALVTYREGKEIKRVALANELADHIIIATGNEATERGVGATILASDGASGSGILSLLKKIRTEGNAALDLAYPIAAELAELDTSNATLRKSISEVNRLYSEVQAKRKVIDRKIGGGSVNLVPGDWIKLSSSFIGANARLRLAANTSSASTTTLQEPIRMNLQLKQAVWLVSEYAGRERAVLASFIAGKKPVDTATRERLKTFRAIVDLNMSTILALKSSKQTDSSVIAAVETMNTKFRSKFHETRLAVYAAADTGEYPLSGTQWIEQSTSAINTILGVSAAVGEVVNTNVLAELAASKRSTVVSLIVLGFVILLGVFSMLVVRSKIINPIRYISDTMADVERTGDLTIQIDVKSHDENGQMANSFNKMIGKFHDIISELRSSTDRLASSSEQLSTTSEQIADGTQLQSKRAEQVSASSQEMGATLGEVVNNVTSATEAAREASTVAIRGGSVVTQTIDSMNGISETAKESREIITTLGDRSEEIGNIINVINDIADQTNLLALNAAIEAARAGEQGRGFAVVADEVRKLAEKTMTATNEIGDMIKSMQNETAKAIASVKKEVEAVDEGVAFASEAGESLKEIVAKVDVVTSMMDQISIASNEQSTATEQITVDIEGMASIIGETSTGAAQIAEASQEVAEIAVGIKTNVDMFHVSNVETRTVGNVLSLAERGRQAGGSSTGAGRAGGSGRAKAAHG
jgi:methyl-accepting chemotaxis protein